LRVLPLLAALAAASVADVEAAPAADVVVLWAPGEPPGPVEQAARAHGAAVIDRSPAPPPTVETAQLLQRGLAAYDALKLDEARAVLDQARDLADRTGAAGLTMAQLSDIFLYRGLVRAQSGDDTAAWDELVTAIVVDPSRELDPARFPPKIVEQFRRARDTLLHDRPAAELQIDVPAGCTSYVDGAASSGKEHKHTGAHWIRVACADRTPWGQRIDLTTLGAHVAPDPSPYAPPSDAELLVQARVAGARALVVAEVHGVVATARLVTLDGRERDRRTVGISKDLAPLAVAVGDLLTPPNDRRHWYQSRWVWAAGAAALAAIVLVPVTAAIASDTGAAAGRVQPKGLPPL
jgi:hypothetical protein